MEFLVFTNGNRQGSGSHLSVYLHLLASCFDSQLSWPLLGTFKVELLNQLEDRNHHAGSVKFIDNECSHSGTAGGWGISKIIE